MSLLFRAIRKVLPEPALPLARRVHTYLRQVEAGLARGWGVLVVRFHWLRLSSGLATPGHLAPGRRKLLSHRDSSTAQDPGLSGSAINKTESRKPHVLFVMQKWCYCLPACGPTNHEHNLVGSLEASGLATYERFYFDEYYQQHGRPCDAAFLKLCMASEADLIVLIRVPVRASDPDPPNVKLETMRLIKERIGIPIIAVWPDAVHLHEAQVAESCLAFASFNVLWDSVSASLKTTRKPEQWLRTWTPQDPRIYYDAGLKRDIDVSFVGGLKYFPDRKSGLAALRSGGISVLHAGGQRENRLSVEEYASIHKRSKIGLNFCLTPDKQIQCKGRVFEYLAVRGHAVGGRES